MGKFDDDLKEYLKVNLKVPIETSDYEYYSNTVVSLIEKIMDEAIDNKRNQIIINTNLKLGIPMENINKIAGPFIEAWAYEIFNEKLETNDEAYQLLNVEAGERLNMADILLQFKVNRKRQSSVTANVDVKATSNDIINSGGKSPNITSFARIRSAYIKDPDYIFIILSIKHKVYSTRNNETKMMMGIMEAVDFNAYDLKYISSNDLSYNPALGTGQIQIKDIHYVSTEKRTVAQFIEMLDIKFLRSKKGFSQWMIYAKKNAWIKE